MYFYAWYFYVDSGIKLGTFACKASAFPTEASSWTLARDFEGKGVLTQDFLKRQVSKRGQAM